MEQQLIKKTEEAMKPLFENGIDYGNVELLYKLVKIRHMVKGEEDMYGNYGRYGRPGYDSYGRRGYDAKYRGYDSAERLGEHYGRYMDSHARYGTGDEAKSSLRSMLECLEDFSMAIKEEAKSPEEEQMMRETFSRLNV